MPSDRKPGHTSNRGVRVIFGTNAIVGARYFKDAGALYVTSIFYTLQGEGPFAGQPAIFIRFARCQLACSFCDTYFDKGQWMGLEDIQHCINNRISDYFITHGQRPPHWTNDTVGGLNLVLVITGGEPMLQPKITELTTWATDHFRDVQIESNGLVLQSIPDTVALVVSPKCREQERTPISYLKPPERVLNRANVLKFLIRGDIDSPYSGVPQWAFDWRDKTHRPIYVSPMAEYVSHPATEGRQLGDLNERSVAERVTFWQEGMLDKRAMQRNYEYAAGYAMRNGCILTLQQQLLCSIP